MKDIKPFDITIGALFVGLMAIGANIAIWFPFLMIPIGGMNVPLSLQTFFAVIAGLLLGKKVASLSMITYLLTGVAGVPVFAQMKAGPFVLFDYTGGFLLSFILVAYVTGLMAERLSEPKLLHYSFAALIGVFVNYFIGVNYMYIAMNTWLELQIPYAVTWTSMIPFLIKDVGVSMIAATFMVKIAKRIHGLPSIQINT